MMEAQESEKRGFEADVARLLHMMVHSVYSDRDVFLRELISNAADACEKLRVEALERPELLKESYRPEIRITADPDDCVLEIADNGIGMDRQELIESLGTIARSGTRDFLDRISAASKGDQAELIGQFGVGFYSAFMVASQVEVISRKAESGEAWKWSSDGKGTFEVAPAAIEEAPQRGTRIRLHLTPDARDYTGESRLEHLIRKQSGHVPVPILLAGKKDGVPRQVTDGTALWARPRSGIEPSEYVDFYRGLAGQHDDPALTLHYRAEGRQEYSTLAFVPGSRPFDLFDPERRGHMKLYVRRVFITDDVDLVPRYLRFVRGLVDSADLPLNLSREMIQESPLLAAIRKGVSNRILGELEKLAASDAEAYGRVWENFGVVLKEGLYEDPDRRDQLLKLARFRTLSSPDKWISLAEYVAGMKDGQAAIYYIAGDDREQLLASPQLEGYKARGLDVLLFSDAVDGFWVQMGPRFEDKAFRSVTQGGADLDAIPLADAGKGDAPGQKQLATFLAFVKSTLGDAISDACLSDRLTTSPACLVAPDSGLDRQVERLLSAAGQISQVSRPILEINPRHERIKALIELGDKEMALRQDIVHLLFDEARALDGELPADARAFCERLSRVIGRAIRAEGG